MNLLTIIAVAALTSLLVAAIVNDKAAERAKVLLWHVLSLIEVCVGGYLFVGDLMTSGREGHAGFGILLLGFGAWAWTRGARARRALAMRSA